MSGRTQSASRSNPTKQDAPVFAVSRVPLELVDHVWPHIAPMVERGLRHGAGDRTSVPVILGALKRGEAMLWAVHEGPEIIAGVVVSIKRYATKTVVFVELAAGRDMGRWVARVIELLRDYRDLIGADSVEALCRLGMAKRLKERGGKHKAVLVEL